MTHDKQPLDARAHIGDGDSAARELNAGEAITALGDYMKQRRPHQDEPERIETDWRADGLWPLCPRCESDELYSLVPPSISVKAEPTDRLRCYVCQWEGFVKPRIPTSGQEASHAAQEGQQPQNDQQQHSGARTLADEGREGTIAQAERRDRTEPGPQEQTLRFPCTCGFVADSDLELMIHQSLTAGDIGKPRCPDRA
jgi:hypothetical protein